MDSVGSKEKKEEIKVGTQVGVCKMELKVLCRALN